VGRATPHRRRSEAGAVGGADMQRSVQDFADDVVRQRQQIFVGRATSGRFAHRG